MVSVSCCVPAEVLAPGAVTAGSGWYQGPHICVPNPTRLNPARDKRQPVDWRKAETRLYQTHHLISALAPLYCRCLLVAAFLRI